MTFILVLKMKNCKHKRTQIINQRMLLDIFVCENEEVGFVDITNKNLPQYKVVCLDCNAQFTFNEGLKNAPEWFKETYRKFVEVRRLTLGGL